MEYLNSLTSTMRCLPFKWLLAGEAIKTSMKKYENLRNQKRVGVKNANTSTKADSTRISASFVNIGLARYSLCEFS